MNYAFHPTTFFQLGVHTMLSGIFLLYLFYRNFFLFFFSLSVIYLSVVHFQIKILGAVIVFSFTLALTLRKANFY